MSNRKMSRKNVSIKQRYLVALGAVGVIGLSMSACSMGDGSNEPGAAAPKVGDVPTPVLAAAQRQPPPISGGTLLITHDGQTAFVADPDRDQIYLVDLASRNVSTIPMEPGDEPWRAAEDGAGRVHVSLRSGGAVATIDLKTRSVVDRQNICVAPRGIAYDVSTDHVYVACESGELVDLPASANGATRVAHLERDLRDVVVQGEEVLVSRFRSAELLHVSKATWSASATIDHPPASTGISTPAVAWRTIGLSGGRTFMLHQRGQSGFAVPTAPGGYGSGMDICHRSIVEGALTTFTSTDITSTLALSDAVVPVDVAVSPDEAKVAIIATANAKTAGLPQVLVFSAMGAVVGPDVNQGSSGDCIFASDTPTPPGQATAAAFLPNGGLVVQTRQPASLFLAASNVTIPLSSIDRSDAGHELFHANSGAHIACASCHAEGGDDGRTWTFDGEGARRTPSLRGTVEGTAPYHWGGEMRDFSQLVHEVLTERMSGPTLSSGELAALTTWVNGIPAPVAPPPSDPDAVARGDSLFHGAAACFSCHSGPKLTNNETVDVGTGGPFQVPPLIGVGYRAPFMHTGCAATLTDRFTCGGASHGSTADLTSTQISDLVAYLSTL